MYTLHLVLAILAAIFILLSVWLLFTANAKAPLLAAVSLMLLFNIPEVAPGWKTELFWCVAAVISFIATMMLPTPIRESRVGVVFMSLGAIAGAFVGAAIAHAAIIIGAVLGVVLGAVVFSRTGSGAVLQFPSHKFFNYLYAKGFPAVIVSCISVIVTISIINLFVQ